MNSHSQEERPNDLLTGQWIVNGSVSKYWNIRNSAASFGIRLLRTTPSSQYASSLAVIQVHSRGIPDGLPGPQPHLPLTLGFAEPEVECFASRRGLSSSVCPRGCNQFVRRSELSESRTCHAQLGLSDNQILPLPDPIGTVWQSNNVHSHVGIDTSIEPLCT